MHVPKKFFQDRTVLLLLSINAFLALVVSVKTLFQLDGGRVDGYIVEYRANLGLSAFRTGTATELIAFILFVSFVLVFHFLLSVKAYHIRRHFSLAILGMGTLLLSVALVVSNALLILR